MEPELLGHREAKQIVLLRQELSACWARADYHGVMRAMFALSQIAGNDNRVSSSERS